MSPAENSTDFQDGRYVVVAWDLDTTGRRLIDEICQVAGFYIFDKEECDFSQYVMPHKNPNPGARRSFGIKVASMGRYRMLKDVETGKILKTKSEVSALQDFISWLKEAKEKSKTDGVVLVCHEPARKVLVPLFLEALRRYNLLEAFDEVVVAFANSVKVAEKYADSEKVTSYSLRSLCKTILNNTNPATASACDRAKVLVEILSKVTQNNQNASGESSENTETLSKIDASKVLTVATSVKSERDEVTTLKSVLGTQGTLRPIFEGQLKQKRAIREHALGLRKLVAEAGLKYEDLAIMYKENIISNAAPSDEIFVKQFESRRTTLKASIMDASDKDLEELVKLLDKHFIKTTQISPPNSNNATNVKKTTTANTTKNNAATAAAKNHENTSVSNKK